MANQTTLTAQEIIDQALAQVGNPDISSYAELELNAVLDRLYDMRWPFLRKTATGSVTAGETGTALPADFTEVWDLYSFRVQDSSASSDVPVEMMSIAEYQALSSRATRGTPKKVVIDYEAQTFTFFPVPDKAYTYSILYKKRPARITNFLTVVDFPNEQLLIQFIFAWALKWEDDDRADAALQAAEFMLRKYLQSYNISPSKKRSLAISPAVFPSMTFVR